MKLISCHIENFGKIRDLDYDFVSGKNIIHEDNGWGKSTFAAFIRAMFYGFLGDGKKDLIENERKKYKPWNQGVYGGSITFDAGGKKYRVEKVFGDKKSGSDSFALYDAETNLKSSDYSEKIGEELFGIDIDSFMRTIFIAQQDCETDATVGIRAKIGDVSDETADMGDYDNVMASIGKYLNSNTPGRSSGKLYKLNSSIALLKEKVRGKDDLERKIAELEESVKSAKEKIADGEEKFNSLQEEASTLSAKKDKQLTVQKYRDILKKETRLRENYQKEIAVFPGNIPEAQEIDDLIYDIDEANRKRDALNSSRASARGLKSVIDDRAQKKAGAKRLKVTLMILGLLVIAGGAAAYFLMTNVTVAIIIAAVGLIVIILSLFTGKTSAKDSDEDSYEYDELMRAIEEDEVYIERTEDACREFTEKYGFDESAATKHYLLKLRENIKDAGRIEEELESVLSEKEEYESEHGILETDGETADDNSSLELINREAKAVRAETDRIKGTANQLQSNLATALEKLESISDSEEELSRQEEEYEHLSARYDIAKKTGEFLEKAKESFSSKYMDEIKEAFDKYHDMISDSTDKYELDANLNILLKEAGTTHDIRSLSEGYRDLVGLCRRMAMVDAMYDMEKPFLIFDDPFVNLDESRLSGALKFLDEISHEYQVIYFSCHQSRCGVLVCHQ